MKKINRYSSKFNKKLIVLTSCLVLVFTIVFASKLKPTRLLGNLYNINDVEKNIDKLKVGDIINYEINGYSNWQVVSIDKESGTLDVVSKTNVEDITLKTKEDYENALETFQTTANKYTDNSYAIKARCVNRADLDNFGFDEVFWNADIYNGSVAYSNGRVKYNGTTDAETTYQFLPYVIYKGQGEYWNYNIGDEYDISIYGIDKWVFTEQPYSWNENIMLMPATPISVNISNEEFVRDPRGYINNILSEIKASDPNIVRVGNFGEYYGFDFIRYNDDIKNRFVSQSSKYSFFSGNMDSYLRDNYIELGFDTYNMNFDDDEYEYKWINYNKELPVTKGFRPIVTLKYTDKLVNGKSFKSALKVGDNVDYNAKEYYNWKVLSIDEKNKTVDIISGGIVSNLKLYGLDDFDNYEQTLQNIADQYKVGKNAISARSVAYTDLPNLNKMKDKVNTKYWTVEKKDYNRKSVNDTSSPYAANAFYDASIMYYDLNESTIQRRWVSLYISSGLDSGGGNVFFSAYNGTEDLSYTAGIRPVITLKLDSVKKIDDDKKDEIINNSTSNENKMSNEQMNNSNNYITSDKTTENNYFTIVNKKVIKPKKSSENSDNEKIYNNDDVEPKEEVNEYHNQNNGSGDKLVKYIIIAIIVLNVVLLAQIVISTFIIKNLKK